jgi:CRISPR-associated protein Cas1
MRKLLNTLYVSTQGAYIHRENETVVVEIEKEKRMQLPIHTIGGIVCFGNVLCSPHILALCAERGIAVSFLSPHGKFWASVRGPVSGNILLRRQQYRMADDEKITKEIAANIVSGKLANCCVVLSRVIRDHADKVDLSAIRKSIENKNSLLNASLDAQNTDEIRGYEGQAAAVYFKIFNQMIVEQKEDFVFKERNRRPPLDEVNALLSFMYTLLAHDVRSALETVGLDPQAGFLHRDRSGRHSLALDIMEEFRPVLADRVVLSLINRRQVGKKDFNISASGAVVMNDAARKTILLEWQQRKQDEVYHPYIEEKIPIGLLFFVQANLMARYIRGDIDGYPPFFWR